MKKSIILSFCFITAIACIGPSAKNSSVEVPEVKQSYETGIRPIIVNTCTQCHAGFNEYPKFTRKLKEVKKVLEMGKMPPASIEFEESQRQEVLAWIDKALVKPAN